MLQTEDQVATSGPLDTEQGGLYGALDLVAANPPDDEGEMEELVAETDRIHALTSDDPTPEIPFLTLPDQDITETFRARLREASAARAPLERAWLKAFADYNQQIDPAAAVWRSKVKLPYIRALVLSAIPSGLAAAFDSGTILKMEPLHPEFEKKAASMERLVQWQLTVKTQARKSFRHFLHYRALYGTGILKISWRRETRQMMVRVPVYDNVDDMGNPLPPGTQGEFLGTKRVLKTIEVHDEPTLEAVDLWNALPAPWSKVGEIPYFIEKEETTRENLLAAADGGALGEVGGSDPDGEPMTPKECVEEWFAANPNMQIDGGSEEYSLGTRGSLLQSIGLQSAYAGAGQGGTEKDPGPNPCVVYWYCTRDVKVCFAGDGSGRILGKQPKPEETHDLPYVISQYDEILPGFVWGAGIGMAAGPLQTQIDFDVNQTNDGRRLAINPVLKRKRLGSALMGDIQVRPGAIWDVREQDDIEELQITDKSQNAVEWLGMLVRWGDRATGIGDLQRGLADTGVDTATEAAILDSNAITRKLSHVFEIRDVWQQVGRLLVQLNKQFFSEEKRIKVMGPEGSTWETITPEDIFGEFDVVPGASITRSDIVLQRRDWITHYDRFNGDPLTNQYELRRRYWAAFDQEHLDRLLQPPPPPPMDPMDEEMLLQHGLEVPPSPDEDFAAHIQVHALALQALKASPIKNTLAIAAHLKHLDETRQMLAMAQQQMAMGAATVAGGGAPSGPEKSGATRDRPSELGKQQGSHGQDGESPGPRNPPGRPVRSMP